MALLDLTFRKRTLAALAIVAAQFILIAVFAGAEARTVLLPVVVAISIAELTIVMMWNRDGVIPIYDLGSVVVLATLCYAIIPPLQYVASGMQHTAISAFQFWVLQPGAHEIAALTWTYTAYLGAVAASYLIVSRRVEIRTPDAKPDPADIRFLLTGYLACVGLLFFFKLLYGVSTSVTYQSDLLAQNAQALRSMPVFLQQLFSIVLTFSFMLKIGLLLCLFLNWRRPAARAALVLWLVAIGLGYFFKMGARSELMLTVFASMFMYHRFVRPLRFLYVSAGAVLLLGAFFFLGIARGASNVSDYLANLSLGFQYRNALLSMQNEFQVLFAGTYDLLWMKQHDVLKHVPLQFLFYDIVMLLPQQLLPFTKIDVQEWYLQHSSAPGFFMYNPIAQSILGFGLLEVLVRGALLGGVFGWVRNWYVRNSGDFWKTFFYSYVIVLCYYGARGTAMYFFAHKLIFTIVPIYLLSRLVSRRIADRANTTPVLTPVVT